MPKISIDFDWDDLIIKGSGFANNAAAEEAISQVRAIENLANQLVTELKDHLQKEMEKEGLRAIKGDTVNITMRESGSKYVITDYNAVPKEVVKTKISIDSDALEKYMEEHGGMPSGVEYSTDRPVSLVFKDVKASVRG